MIDWRERAACRGHDDPDIFTSVIQSDVATAKLVCHSCPVTAECLALAAQLGDQWSVMGGLTPQERREHRRRHDWLRRCAYCRRLFVAERRKYCSNECRQLAGVGGHSRQEANA